jgi:hypothetical protein
MSALDQEKLRAFAAEIPGESSPGLIHLKSPPPEPH